MLWVAWRVSFLIWQPDVIGGVSAGFGPGKRPLSHSQFTIAGTRIQACRLARI
jgi:hypothetical protein